MTGLVVFLAALLAVHVARRAYPEAIGESLSLDGPALDRRGAGMLAAMIGVFVFAGIVGPWLALASVTA